MARTFRRVALPALLTAAALAVCASYLLAAGLRLRLGGAGTPALVALAAGAVLLAARPFAGSCLVLLALPLFGNHPGGGMMELLNVGLAACALGLCARAVRQARPLPRGPVWTAAGLVVLSAAIAVIPALPAVRRWSWYVAWLPSTVTQALTASETVALYSVGSAVELLLAAGWAYALCWAGADRRFAERAMRCVAVSLFAVMLAGVLDFHHLVDLRRGFLARIDPEIDYLDRFQSVFWNPGWFAWFFTLAFGLAAGLLWAPSRGWRVATGVGLVLSYGYFLTTSQRGGWVAIHVVLLVLAWLLTGGFRARRRWVWLAGLLLLAGLLVPLALLHFETLPERWFQGLRRLLETPIDVNRRSLWQTALRMWGAAPLFGIGEGAFGWRYRDFVPAGSSLDIGLWGDAHNTWLQLLATRGLAGLAAFVALVVVLGRALARSAATASPRDRATHRGPVLGGAAFLTYSLVQHLFYLQCIQVLFWLMVGMVAMTSPPLEARPRRSAARIAVAVALVVAVLAQVAWTLPEWRRVGGELSAEPHGFYPSSHPDRRWSSRRGTLCVHPTAPVMAIGVSTADPIAAVDPVVVTLSTGGRRLDRFHLWRRRGLTRTVFLPETLGAASPKTTARDGACGGPERLPLTIEVSRLWTPRSVGMLDGRLLGVNVVGPTFRAMEPGERLGFVAAGSGEAERSWIGARASMQLATQGDRRLLVVPVRSALAAAGRSVSLDATWNGQPVGSVTLEDDRWHDLRIEVDGRQKPGVLTLHASDVEPTDARPAAGAPDFVSVEIGPVSPEGRTPSR